MGEDMIETLVTELASSPATAGFSIPFTIDRLCTAFGDRLGGNTPEPAWFDGYDVLIAIRRGSRGTPHMPVAALLRRRADGALRLIASDHLLVRNSYGADFMLGNPHRSLALDALLDACDEGETPKALVQARVIIEAAHIGVGKGPIDILAIRRQRDDLADIRASREIAPVIADLSKLLSKLSSADRRAISMSHLAALSAEIGVSGQQSNPA